MICWYCYWGWPKQIRDIYDRAEADIDCLIREYPDESNDWEPLEEPRSGEEALNYGPAHVVWSDENWDCAEGCLKDMKHHLSRLRPSRTWPLEILVVIRRSLEELIALPDEIRFAEPEGYDGEHPENYPPAAGLEMVK